MARRSKVWMYAGARAGNKPSPAEKDAITLACERVIQNVLIPRFLPEIRPHAEFNYPIGIHGTWMGNKYRFVTRYKSDSPNRIVEGFDAPFARLLARPPKVPRSSTSRRERERSVHNVV